MTTLDEQVLHAINTNNSFVIVSHIRPDGDAIGSALGLAHSLRLAGKTAEVVLEDGVAEKYMSLTGADSVGRKIESDYDYLIVVDCSDAMRTGNALRGATPDLVIDHHKTNLNFGKLNLVESETEATALVLAQHMPLWG